MKGKVAIVTGGSRGIGKAIALRFTEAGMPLVLVATSQERLTQARKEVEDRGGQAEVLAGDIAEPAFSDRIVQTTLEKFGRLDVLVNCAGVITRAPVEALSLDDWFRVIDVNLHGTFHLSRAVLPIMRAQAHGKIINITSQMARLPHPGASPSYEVSKAGIAALTRHLAFHYARFNVCVNAIAPGSIDTGLAKSMNPETWDRIRGGIPKGRLGEPSEVAEVAFFLASPLSDYITGATIGVTGGALMD
jgi:3-oxoacyl-[acyl-carrier protein] reductase